MIIAAYAGTGKTTLARLYPQVAVDFVCMPYKYQLEQDGESDEACKANPDNVMQDDWPYNLSLQLSWRSLAINCFLFRQICTCLLCSGRKSCRIFSAIHRNMRKRFIDSVFWIEAIRQNLLKFLLAGGIGILKRSNRIHTRSTLLCNHISFLVMY